MDLFISVPSSVFLVQCGHEIFLYLTKTISALTLVLIFLEQVKDGASDVLRP